MAEPDHPTLPELHEMIVGLARDNSILKKQLSQARNELKTLRAEVADLGKAFKYEVTNVTKEFKHVHRFLIDIFDQLRPLVHKVFPGSLATQRQIAAIIKRNRSNSPDTNEPG